MATRARLHMIPVDRLAALENDRQTIGERLTRIETKVDQIYDLLVQAKGIVWLGTKIVGGITAIAAVTGATVAVLRYINGM
jgi:hypothetical protein